jgi:hypothetical protein
MFDTHRTCYVLDASSQVSFVFFYFLSTVLHCVRYTYVCDLQIAASRQEYDVVNPNLPRKWSSTQFSHESTTEAVLSLGEYPRTAPSQVVNYFLLCIGFLPHTAIPPPPPRPPRCRRQIPSSRRPNVVPWLQDKPRATPYRRPGSTRPRSCRTGLNPQRISSTTFRLQPTCFSPLFGWCWVDLIRCVLHPLFLLAYWIHSGNQFDCTIWHHVVTKEKQIKFCPLHPLETMTCVVSL